MNLPMRLLESTVGAEAFPRDFHKKPMDGMSSRCLAILISTGQDPLRVVDAVQSILIGEVVHPAAFADAPPHGDILKGVFKEH